MHQKTSSEWQLLPLEEWSGSNFQSACLAVFICATPLMVLLHGIGLGSIASAAVLIVPLCGLVVGRGKYHHTLYDALFILFVALLALSTAINGLGPIKDELLLCISLAAFVAARLGAATGRLLFIIVGVVGAAGVVIVAVALVEQWNHPHGKPLIFGEFDSAPAQFFTCFAILTIWRRRREPASTKNGPGLQRDWARLGGSRGRLGAIFVSGAGSNALL